VRQRRSPPIHPDLIDRLRKIMTITTGATIIMKFKCDFFKRFMILHFKCQEARQFRVFALLIVILALIAYPFLGIDRFDVLALAVLILLILLYRMTIYRARDRAFNETVEVYKGMLIAKHSFRMESKVIHVTRTVTSISEIRFYEKTEEIEVIGHNNLEASDGQNAILTSCRLENCYGPDFLKALESNFAKFTRVKRGGMS
jgi:hypothetical protein